MPITCPNCGSRTAVKHCSSKTCNWFRCRCKAGLNIEALIFNILGGSFEQPKK